MALLRWLVLALAVALSFQASAQTRQRIALVVGNGDYDTVQWQLDNPQRDAVLISDRLRSLGFDVDLVMDADRREMEAAFERFGRRLKSAGASAVGLFYYAGHGAQQNGVNYLVPIDARARTADQLRYQSPPMQFLLDDMAEAGNEVNIIILDACRDMPLEEGYRAIGRGGLADLGRQPNVFIAYAASPGRTAADGAGQNSPFTTVLAAALSSQPNDPISLLFEDVNIRVRQQTAGAQVPEYRNGLGISRWSFAAATAPPASVSPTGRRSTREAEVDIFYDSARVTELSRITVIARLTALNRRVDVRATPNARGRETGAIGAGEVFFISGRVAGTTNWYMVAERVRDGDAQAFMTVGYVTFAGDPPQLDESIVPAVRGVPSTLAEGRVPALMQCDEIEFEVRDASGRTVRDTSTRCRGPEGTLLSA